MYLPGFFSLPPVDRDEARFAQASRQMFESVALPEAQKQPAWHGGGLVAPRVQERPRLNKPPLIYWLQAGSAALLTGGEPERDAIWMYRLPSLLAAVLAVLLTWRLGVAMFAGGGGGAAWLGAALLAVCPVLVWEAHQARADVVLLACVCGAMRGLWEVGGRHGGTEARTQRSEGEEAHRGGVAPWRWVVLLWVSVGLGVLVKGPIVVMVVGLAGVSLGVVSRSWRWARASRPLLGAGVVAAMVAPWVIAVGERTGWGTYLETVWAETIGRSAQAREGHWGPPGYHLILLVVLFWPGVMLTGLALRRAWTKALRRGRPAGAEAPGGSGWRRIWLRIVSQRAGRRPELFLLAWLVPSWLVFELVSTKLPHYTLVLYPAVALLTGRGVLAAAGGAMAGLQGAGARAGYVVWGLVGVMLAGAPAALLLAPLAGPESAAATPALLIALAVGAAGAGLTVLGVHAAFAGAFVRAQVRGLCAGVLIAAGLLGVAIPAKRDLWVSPRVAAVLERMQSGFASPVEAGAMGASAPGTGDAPGARATLRAVAAVGYHEDSLVFLLRGRLDKINPGEVAGWIASHPGGLIVSPPATAAEALGIAVPDALADAARGERLVRGWNYSKGEAVELVVWEAPGR